MYVEGWSGCVEVMRGVVFFFFQAEDGIRDHCVTEFRRVLFRSLRCHQSYQYLNQHQLLQYLLRDRSPAVPDLQQPKVMK